MQSAKCRRKRLSNQRGVKAMTHEAGVAAKHPSKKAGWENEASAKQSKAK
jgi:hypothetical protein